MDEHHAEVTANMICCNILREKKLLPIQLLLLIQIYILSCPVLTLENQEQGSATQRIDRGTKPSVEKINITGQNVQLSIKRTGYHSNHTWGSGGISSM